MAMTAGRGAADRGVGARRLELGEQAPWFTARSTQPAFRFDQVAGRTSVLVFLGSSLLPGSREVLADLSGRHRAAFDDDGGASCFVVTTDPDDARLGRLAHDLPGIRVVWDLDGQVSRRYGVHGPADRHSLVLDQRLRVVATIPLDARVGGGDDPTGHVDRVAAAVRSVPAFDPPQQARPQAPALVIPGVFSPALCRELIERYDRQGGRASGFMREVDGLTVEVHDGASKRRRDVELPEGDELRRRCLGRLRDVVAPEVARSFQFGITRVERYLVACYDGQEQGFFRRHRDNTTRGTAHRRFACTINLNTGDYDGGELVFPEFGHQRFVAPAGGAVIFSCSLLHEARPVTAGRRFAFLPFLYDEAGAEVRRAGQAYVVGPPA